jgi:penicillin amidase
MARIQADLVSVQAAGLLAHLVRPFVHALEDPRARRAAALLLEWDCQMLADSAPAALYHLFYRELLQHCFQPIMERQAAGSFTRYFSLLHLAVPAADAALLTSDRTWFPDGPRAAVETCLRAAWEAAAARLGPDPATWRWGSLHRLTLSHTFGRGRGLAVRLLAWLLHLNRGPYARPGDGMTVNLSAFPLTGPFEVAVGPSYRQIIDLGDPDASRWIIAGGVSGDPRSAHYADQIALWLRGEYRPMRLLPLADARRGGVLRLLPSGEPRAASREPKGVGEAENRRNGETGRA